MANTSTKPILRMPGVVVPLGNGEWLFREGKPVEMRERIGTRQAAALLGMSARTVQAMCDQGRFRTATKLTPFEKSHWWIELREVQEWLEGRNGA